MLKIIFSYLQILLTKWDLKSSYLNLDSHKIYFCLNTLSYNVKLSKKIILVLFLCAPASPVSAKDQCYYYVVEYASEQFAPNHARSLKVIYSNIIQAGCDIYDAAISNQYSDALKVSYPDTYFHTSTDIVFGPFKSRGEAAQDRREKQSDHASDQTIINFNYYE